MLFAPTADGGGWLTTFCVGLAEGMAWAGPLVGAEPDFAPGNVADARGSTIVEKAAALFGTGGGSVAEARGSTIVEKRAAVAALFGPACSFEAAGMAPALAAQGRPEMGSIAPGGAFAHELLGACDEGAALALGTEGEGGALAVPGTISGGGITPCVDAGTAADDDGVVEWGDKPPGGPVE